LGLMLNQLLEHMQLASKSNPIKRITEKEYSLWHAAYTFEGLKGIRYGQSFCNHFNITDNILFYTSDHTRCDTYIRKTYLKWNYTLPTGQI
jgi:hypothetical protein